jgi:hypothetical protein
MIFSRFSTRGQSLTFSFTNRSLDFTVRPLGGVHLLQLGPWARPATGIARIWPSEGRDWPGKWPGMMGDSPRVDLRGWRRREVLRRGVSAAPGSSGRWSLNLGGALARTQRTTAQEAWVEARGEVRGSATTGSDWTGELAGGVNGRDGSAPCTREEERQWAFKGTAWCSEAVPRSSTARSRHGAQHGGAHRRSMTATPLGGRRGQRDQPMRARRVGQGDRAGMAVRRGRVCAWTSGHWPALACGPSRAAARTPARALERLVSGTALRVP